MQATKGARRATRWVKGGPRDLSDRKQIMHRRNRRVARQAIRIGKEPIEKQVTGWDIC